MTWLSFGRAECSNATLSPLYLARTDATIITMPTAFDDMPKTRLQLRDGLRETRGPVDEAVVRRSGAGPVSLAASGTLVCD